MASENTKINMSEQLWTRLSALWSWSVDIPVDCDLLYHYYKGDILKKVVKKNKVIFRLAAADTFPDKMEGKAVEVYYDLALEELKKEKKITEEHYSKLSDMDIPGNMDFISHDGDLYRYSKDVEYEEYIICFSKEKDDLYMYNTYTAGSDGYCIHLFCTEIKELKNIGIDNHAVIKLIPVLYGREAIEYIKRKIIDAFSDPAKEEDIEYYICSILNYVRFAAKRKKYEREKEIRLVVFLPKNCNEPLPNIQFITDEHDNKYILFSVSSDLMADVSSAPYNSKEEIQGMRAYLEENGYSRMLREKRL